MCQKKKKLSLRMVLLVLVAIYILLLVYRKQDILRYIPSFIDGYAVSFPYFLEKMSNET